MAFLPHTIDGSSRAQQTEYLPASNITPKKGLLEKRNSAAVEQLMEQRRSYRYTGEGAGRYATAYAVTNDLIDILNEEDAFAFDIADKEMTVDNSVEQKRYMTREKLAEGSEEISGGYYITPEISAKDMHTLGEGTFFAAMN